MRTLSPLCRTATGLACPRRRLCGTSLKTVLSSSSSQVSPAHHRPALTAPITTSAVNNVRKSTRSFTSQSKTVVFPDPVRPDLFYHLLDPPTPIAATIPAYGVSFLYERPPSKDSTGIIGWLPAHISESATDSETYISEDEENMQGFQENPKFLPFLQRCIRMGLSEGVDDVWKDAAQQLRQGWMHINDQRNPPGQDRIGAPDDIIGSVWVESSEIKAETYQPMPTYRVYTSDDGVLQLTPGLLAYLRRALLARTAN